MKKILLSLGTLATIVAPVTTIVACGTKAVHKIVRTPKNNEKNGNNENNEKNENSELAKVFVLTKDETKDDVFNFIKNNKDQKLKITISDESFEFISDGKVHDDVVSAVEDFFNKLESEKNLANEAKKDAERISKIQSDLDSILKSDIISHIKSIRPYTSSSQANIYDFPDTKVITKDGTDFDMKISNIIRDDNEGKIEFDAELSNKMLEIPKLVSGITLSGFKSILDNEHKINNIQDELDDEGGTLALLGVTKTSSETTKTDIESHIQEIVKNNYGLIPTISNIENTSGKVKFELSYEAQDKTNGVDKATKTITLTGFVLDSDRANELQVIANELRDHSYSMPPDSQSLISEDDPSISAGSIEMKSSDDLKNLGINSYTQSKLFNSPVVKVTMIINPMTMMGKPSVQYNGVSSTVSKKELEIYTQQKRNFINLAKYRAANIVPRAKAIPMPTSLKIPKGLKEIPPCAFAGYIIPNDFEFPEGIISIGYDAFLSAEIPEGLTLPSTINKVGVSAFENAKIPGSFSLPEGVTKLGSNAFMDSHIGDDYVLPNSLKDIGDAIFAGSKIGDNFRMPNELNTLSFEPFKNCEFGVGLILPEKIKMLDLGGGTSSDKYVSTFKGAMLPSQIDISKLVIESVKTSLSHATNADIIDLMFKDSGTIDGLIPNYWTHFRKDVLNGMIWDPKSFKQLPPGFRLPNTIRYIDDDAFYKAEIPDGFKLPDSVIEIGDRAFADTKFLGSFILPKNLQKIGVDAFSNHKYGLPIKFGDNFIIPDSVTSIGEGAFNGAEFGAGFTIGKGITKLKYGTFADAIFADDFKLPSTVTELIDEPFKNAKLPANFMDGLNPKETISSNPVHKSIYKS